MEYLKQFQNHIGNNDLPSFISLWQEYCLSDEIDPEELKEILVSVKDSSFAEAFGRYVEEILPLWETLPDSDKKHEVISLVYDLQTVNSEILADFVIKYLEEKNPNDENMAQKIKLVGLKDKVNFRGAVRNFDLLSHMKVGNFFIHTGGWGVGEVMEISMLREQIALEFDYVAGYKELSFDNAFNNLIPIPKDHFLAKRFGDPDSFEEFAKSKPVETIRMLLRDLGPKTAFEIKEELAGLVIEEEDWSRWWGSVRTKLKKDTMVEVPSSQKEPFKLRKTEVSHEDRLQKALAKKPAPDTMIEMVYSFIRDFPTALKNEELKKFLRTELSSVLSNQELTASQEIQFLFILQDLGHEKAQNLKDLVCRIINLEEVVGGIHVLAYRKRMLSEIRTHREDWVAIFVYLLGVVDQNPLRDYILEELLKAKEEKKVSDRIGEIIHSPMQAPAALVWYFQKVMKKKDLPFGDQKGLNNLFEAFFTLLYKIETDPAYKDLTKKMHQFLTTGRFANVRKIFEGASEEVVKEILLLSTKCQILSEHEIKILYSLAEVVHPALGQLRVGGSDEEEQVIWTTQAGYRKIKERIERIATVETLENAKEIEIARSHGDLRENSEYKYALEKRARLQGELRHLSAQIKHMRVLTKEDIDTSSVGVGTKVVLKKKGGSESTYTLLGPWDADPDKGILSFQSKIARDLMGKSEGDEVKLNDDVWQVEKITSYLA